MISDLTSGGSPNLRLAKEKDEVIQAMRQAMVAMMAGTPGKGEDAQGATHPESMKIFGVPGEAPR